MYALLRAGVHLDEITRFFAASPAGLDDEAPDTVRSPESPKATAVECVSQVLPRSNDPETFTSTVPCAGVT